MANKRRCVIVSASPDYDAVHINKSIKLDDFVICADGGMDTLLKTGITPNLIIGDFDSSENITAFPDVERITLKTRKIDTDTMHCAEIALERGYNEFLFLGATGGRTDHALANLSILVYLYNKKAYGVISDKYNDIMLLKKGRNIFDVTPGDTVSVIPFGEKYAKLSYEGLSYPLENELVTVDYPYTISNEAISNKIVITLHEGSALVIFPHN